MRRAAVPVLEVAGCVVAGSGAVVHDAVVAAASAGAAGAGAVPGEHLRGGPAVEFHQVAFGSAAVQPGVAEVVPEPVRVGGHPALPAAAGDDLVDAGGGERPAAVHAEPQLRPPGLRVPGAGAQVAVQAAGRLVADPDGAGPAGLPGDADLAGPAGPGRCGRGRRGGSGSRPALRAGCRSR